MLLLPKHDASEPSRDEFSPSVLEPRISCGIDRSKSLTPQVDGQRQPGSGGSRSPPSLSRGSRPKTSSWSNRTVACSLAKSSVLQNARSPGRLGFLDRPRVAFDEVGRDACVPCRTCRPVRDRQALYSLPGFVLPVPRRLEACGTRSVYIIPFTSFRLHHSVSIITVTSRVANVLDTNVSTM